MTAFSMNREAISTESRGRTSIRLASITLSIVIVLSSIWVADRTEKDQLERATLQVKYEAQLFELFTRSLLQKLDQALLMLGGELLEDGVPPDINAWARRRGILRNPLFQIGIIGPDGRILLTSEGSASVGLDLSDREHFRVHVDNDLDRMFISKPLIGRVTKRWSLNITRAVRSPDRTLQAVTVISVDPANFSDFLGVLNSKQDTTASLIGFDSIIRARAPVDVTREAIGTSIAGFEIEKRSQGASEGAYRAVSGVDGVERIFAFRRLDDFGVTVLVGRDVKEALAGSERERQLLYTAAALAVGLVIGLSMLFQRILRAQDKIRISSALSAQQQAQTRDLLQIMDGCGAALVQANTSGQIVSYNSSFAQMFSVPGEAEVVGQLMDTVTVDGRPIAGQIGPFSKITSASKFPVRFEASFLPKGDPNQRRDIMWSWTRAKTQDEIRYIGVGIDNTELRAKEMMLIQSAKLASLGRLAATLNHEMVQPLNVVRLGVANLATLVSRDAPKEEILARATKAIENIKRTGSILTRFRALVRQDCIGVELVQLADAIHAATGMYEEQFRIDGIRIDIERSDTYTVECSRIELEQVFVNLLANAYDAILRHRKLRKANSESAQWPADFVKMRVYQKPSLHDFVDVTVQDSGGGIPDDVIASVFQPFFTTRSDSGGTGLGLAICRATIEGLKGKLEVSNSEHGARFVVSLPVVGSGPAAPEALQS